MPSLKLFQRDPARPSLRQRAEALKATATRVMGRRKPLPAPGSEEAREAFRVACRETDRLAQAARDGYPDLRCPDGTSHTKHSLGRVFGLGEIAPVDYARLYRRAAEREHRIEAAAIATDLGALWALAFPEEAGRERDDSDDDGEILRLGRQFKEASARETAAALAANDALAEARKRTPERPAALSLTAADHDLNVYQRFTHPEALAYVELHEGDIDWLRRRMPMDHEVLRPIRDGERAHIDHPGRKFDIVPHPEAQARAEEIVAAWDGWRAEIIRLQREHLTPELEQAADEAAEVVESLTKRIAELPARTTAGLRAKLRVLAHYRRDIFPTETADDPDADPDEVLARSIWRDVQSDEGTREPVTVEAAAELPFEAIDIDGPLRSPIEWSDTFGPFALGMHVADKTLRMGKADLITFIAEAADRGEGVEEVLFRAIDTASDAFSGWSEVLNTARARYLVAASAEAVARDARQAEASA